MFVHADLATAPAADELESSVPQFRLWSLLIVVTCCCVIFAMYRIAPEIAFMAACFVLVPLAALHLLGFVYGLFLIRLHQSRSNI